MTEHRSGPRWRVNTHATVKIGESSKEVAATIIDINYRGAKVLMHQRLASDTLLRLQVTLSEEIFLDLEVWIAWQKNYEHQHIYGLYFSKVKEEDKEKIYSFFSSHFPGQLKRQLWPEQEPKKEEEMDDRRIFERFPARFSMNVLCDGEMWERKATTCDVSAKGIGFVTERSLLLKTPVEMWLSLPDSQEPLYTRGTVVWSRPLDNETCSAGVELEKADLMGISRVLRMI